MIGFRRNGSGTRRTHPFQVVEDDPMWATLLSRTALAEIEGSLAGLERALKDFERDARIIADRSALLESPKLEKRGRQLARACTSRCLRRVGNLVGELTTMVHSIRDVSSGGPTQTSAGPSQHKKTTPEKSSK